jgi:hypothetical protein
VAISCRAAFNWLISLERCAQVVPGIVPGRLSILGYEGVDEWEVEKRHCTEIGH